MGDINQASDNGQLILEEKNKLKDACSDLYFIKMKTEELAAGSHGQIFGLIL